MDFRTWLNKYWGSGLPLSQQVQETGLSVDVLQRWGLWLQKTCSDFYVASGYTQIMTKEQVLAQWDKEHPATVVVHTPFGDYEVPVGTNSAVDSALAEIHTILLKNFVK